MLNGIYHVTFSSPAAHGREQGLAVFKNGTVNGGDTGYLYRGNFEIDGSKIKAFIKVTRWNERARSLFGNIQEYSLVLTGSIVPGGDSFNASGTVDERPQLTIEISGRKLSNAV